MNEEKCQRVVEKVSAVIKGFERGEQWRVNDREHWTGFDGAAQRE